MNIEGQRAAAEFRARLQALHARGDEILKRKGTLVQREDDISDNLVKLLAEFVELCKQAAGDAPAGQLEPIPQLVASIVDRVGDLESSWDQLEVKRAEILRLRKAFDSGQLDRIENGRRSDTLSGVPRLSELDQVHGVLKDDTARYFEQCDVAIEQNNHELDELARIDFGDLNREVRAAPGALIDRLKQELHSYQKWIDSMGNQYSGTVYNLDDDYRKLRHEMEIWEPLQ